MFTQEVKDGLALALVQPSFAKQYLQIVAQEREYLGQWLSWPAYADSEAFFLNFVQNSLQSYAAGKSWTCAMIYRGQVVGNISFNTINTELKKVEIGYWLSQQYQGRGIVSQSVKKMVEIAFHQLEMEKVQISAAVENRPSRRVCERLGFELEGVITRAENLNGMVVDHAIYGMSREKWSES